MADNTQFQEALKRGSAHGWRGRWAEAAQEYRVALSLKPDDQSALNYLAMALNKSGQHQEALDAYQRVWKSQPSNLAALQRIAELQETLGDRDSATSSYRLLADAHSRRQSHEEALKFRQRIVELKPGDPTYWQALMETAGQVGSLGDVVPRCLNLARDMFLRDRFQEAFQVVEQVRKIDPTSPVVPRLMVAFRRALEYTYRTAAAGEDIQRAKMSQLIPSIEQLEQSDLSLEPGDVPSPQAVPLPSSPAVVPVPRPDGVAVLAAGEPMESGAASAPPGVGLEAGKTDGPEVVSAELLGYLKQARELALNTRFKEAFEVAQRIQALYPNSPAVISMVTSLRHGLEYVYRAVALGQEILVEELVKLIPPVEEESPPAEEPPTLDLAPDPEEPLPVGEPLPAPYLEESPLAVQTDTEDPPVLVDSQLSPEAPEIEIPLAEDEAVSPKGETTDSEESTVVEESRSVPMEESEPIVAEEDESALVEEGELSVLAEAEVEEPPIAEPPPATEPAPAEVSSPEDRPLLEEESPLLPDPTEQVLAAAIALPEETPEVEVSAQIEEPAPVEEEASALSDERPAEPEGEPIGLEEASTGATTSGEEPSRPDEVMEEPLPGDQPAGEASPAAEAVEESAGFEETSAPEQESLVAAVDPVEEPLDEAVTPTEGSFSEAPAQIQAQAGNPPPITKVQPPARSSVAPNPAPAKGRSFSWKDKLANMWNQMSMREPEEDEIEEDGEESPATDAVMAIGDTHGAAATFDGSPDSAVSAPADATAGTDSPGAGEAPPVASDGESGSIRSLDGAQETDVARDDDDVVGRAESVEALGSISAEAESGDIEPEGPSRNGSSSPEIVPGGVVAEEEPMAVPQDVGSVPEPVEAPADAPDMEEIIAQAEGHVRSGRVLEAIAAYELALEFAPTLLPALLSSGRLHLSVGQLEEADSRARQAVNASPPKEGDESWPSAELLIEVLRERVEAGDLVGAARGMAWLRSKASGMRLSAEIAEMVAGEPVEALGQCIGEHLEEIALLPLADMEEIVLALDRGEQQLGAGQLRSAADEMYQLIVHYPDFLPAQSLLGRILVAQGREEEARDRARRLLELYEMRGSPRHGLEVLWWSVALGVSNGEARAKLVQLLRGEGRLRDAEWVELAQWGSRPGGTRVPAPSHLPSLTEVRPPAGGSAGEASEAEGMAGKPVSPVLISISQQSPGIDPGGNGAGASPIADASAGGVMARLDTGVQAPAWEPALVQAEESHVLGDRDEVARLVRSALESEDVGDEGARTALLRVLQLSGGGDEVRGELADSLRRLGLSEDLAD